MDTLRCLSIRQAVICSVLVHGVIFSAMHPMLGKHKGDLGKVVKLEASLRQSVVAAIPEVLPKLEAEPVREIRREEKVVVKTPKAVQPKAEAVKTVSQEETSQISAQETAADAMPSTHAPETESRGYGRVEASELDEYRWALQRALKGKNSYPAMARKRGIIGKVTTRLVWLPDFATPKVELVASSDSNMLDEDALGKLAQAVRVTSMPEVLRNRSFEFHLTVDYSLKNE